MGARRVDGRIEKGLATRGQIVGAATALFAERGYAATSIEQLLTATGLSRGALYHHFPGKDAVFAAVLETVEERLLRDVAEAANRAGSDTVRALQDGCARSLALARDPVVRQIVLLDAPAVLGWDAWRALDERYAFGLLRAGVARLADEGRIARRDVEATARILLAALIEFSLLVARATDAPRSLRDAVRSMRDLIEKLVA